MMAQSLLVELFVEELPPKALRKLGEAFANGLLDALKAQGLADEDSQVTPFASPRRLAAHISGVFGKAPDAEHNEKLMPLAIALNAEGIPTDAFRKKAAKIGQAELVARWPDAAVGSDRLYVAHDGKAEAIFFRSLRPGIELARGLQNALDEVLRKLPIPKVMSYQLSDGWCSVDFVRPAHGLVALHGSQVLPVRALGLEAGRATHGHRFESARDPILISEADSYESQVENEGAVYANFDMRRAEITRLILDCVRQLGGGMQVVDDAALLDEVTALVERPNVLVGQFDAAFLAVPQECLILTMKANQKYFPVLGADGRLTNRFLIVSNISPKDPSQVIAGNERVVRPRLADAQFFFDQDRKKPLSSRVVQLAKVVYHHRLGSQLERTQRVQKLAHETALQAGADAALASRAAYLAKADLVTDMVGEFPELQGVMGRYYALHDGEPESVARAIEQHYWPRFAGDALPQEALGAAVALADKLETVVGMFGIGMAPTGDKDPFGLRRHALGVLRILAETPLALSLDTLLQLARAAFGDQVADSVAQDVYEFMLERLKGYLREKGFEANEIEAVVSQRPTRIDRVLPRLQAVVAFKQLPEAAALAAANKRIQNILKKTAAPSGAPDRALMQDAAETAVLSAVETLAPGVRSLLEQGDFSGALCRLAGVRDAVDRLFDEVMVMAEDPRIRNNRLALLRDLGELMNQVADISKLAA